MMRTTSPIPAAFPSSWACSLLRAADDLLVLGVDPDRLDLDDDRLVALVGDDDAAALLAAAGLGLRLRACGRSASASAGASRSGFECLWRSARGSRLRFLRGSARLGRRRRGRSAAGARGSAGPARPRRRALGGGRLGLCSAPLGGRLVGSRLLGGSSASAAASSAAGSLGPRQPASASGSVLGLGLGRRLLGHGLLGLGLVLGLFVCHRCSPTSAPCALLVLNGEDAGDLAAWRASAASCSRARRSPTGSGG